MAIGFLGGFAIPSREQQLEMEQDLLGPENASAPMVREEGTRWWIDHGRTCVCVFLTIFIALLVVQFEVMNMIKLKGPCG